MDPGPVGGHSEETLDRLDCEVADEDRTAAGEQPRVRLVERVESSRRGDRAAQGRFLREPFEDPVHRLRAR